MRHGSGDLVDFLKRMPLVVAVCRLLATPNSVVERCVSTLGADVSDSPRAAELEVGIQYLQTKDLCCAAGRQNYAEICRHSPHHPSHVGSGFRLHHGNFCEE